jgi:hypothetical protein
MTTGRPPILHFKQCASRNTYNAVTKDPDAAPEVKRPHCNCIEIHDHIMQQKAVQSYLRVHPEEAVESE